MLLAALTDDWERAEYQESDLAILTLSWEWRSEVFLSFCRKLYSMKFTENLSFPKGDWNLYLRKCLILRILSSADVNYCDFDNKICQNIEISLPHIIDLDIYSRGSKHNSYQTWISLAEFNSADRQLRQISWQGQRRDQHSLQICIKAPEYLWNNSLSNQYLKV